MTDNTAGGQETGPPTYPVPPSWEELIILSVSSAFKWASTDVKTKKNFSVPDCRVFKQKVFPVIRLAILTDTNSQYVHMFLKNAFTHILW